MQEPDLTEEAMEAFRVNTEEIASTLTKIRMRMLSELGLPLMEDKAHRQVCFGYLETATNNSEDRNKVAALFSLMAQAMAWIQEIENT